MEMILLDTLIVKSTFENNGKMPKRNTAFGENLSPSFKLENLNLRTSSIAIIMDDLDVPFSKDFNHWVIWNIPPINEIPEGIKPGKEVNDLNPAIQGIGYGKHQYKGPNQPFFIRGIHRYRFTIYGLDTFLDLKSDETKSSLQKKMENHIIQEGTIIGIFSRRMAKEK